MSQTTTIVVCTIVPLLLSGFLNHFAHKSWILYFPVIGIALAVLYFGHLGIRSLNKSGSSSSTKETHQGRPYLWVKEINLVRLDNQDPAIYIEIENTGDLPAFNTTFETTVYPTDKPLAAYPSDIPKPSTAPTRASIPANRSISKTMPGKIDHEAFKRVLKGEYLIYVFGDVSYEDRATGHTHRFEFGGLFNPATNTFKATPFHDFAD